VKRQPPRIANSRGPELLAALAAETGATASTVEQAASGRDVVIVTIPQKAVPRLPRGLFAGLSAVVVNAGNYYPARDGRIDAIEDGLSDSEWVAQVLGRPVVKAFNNILAASLGSRGTPEDTPGRVCLSVVVS
jgi:8-hydroxy-5-deazaflavin:NADPH oxidoreductase